MTTTYAAVQLIANGKPYIFSVDATDGNEATMLNVVSSRGLGDTFAAGATITSVGPCTLNSSDGTGASKSILGAVITDPRTTWSRRFHGLTQRQLPSTQWNRPTYPSDSTTP